MARHLRLEYAGAVYHVTARGNDRAAIFHTEQDRRHLLEVLASMMERYAVVLHAYVLMNNNDRMRSAMRRSISAVRSVPSRWRKSAPCFGSRGRP